MLLTMTNESLWESDGDELCRTPRSFPLVGALLAPLWILLSHVGPQENHLLLMHLKNERSDFGTRSRCATRTRASCPSLKMKTCALTQPLPCLFPHFLDRKISE
jgi:hypothetical protein